MRKINVRSPFYVTEERELQEPNLPDIYFYYSATECGGVETTTLRSIVELEVGYSVKVIGNGETCFEITGQLSETNESDVTFIYDTCDKCNGVPDYNYYSAELCAGGSPIDVRSVDALEVGQIVKVSGYSEDCYEITGSGSSNENSVVTLFNNCEHCSTGIDYKYYDANECDGASSIVVRYDGIPPSNRPVINVSGQGNKCFVLDGESSETSTNDIVAFYENCESCQPVDPFTYYTATECGGAVTVDFKSDETLAIGTSVTLEGYGDTCFEVEGAGSASATSWTNKYQDCSECANANDPYTYFDAQKCDGTGPIIKLASVGTINSVKGNLWKASGQDDNCFSILSETTGGGTFYYTTEICPTCPKDDPYRYWKATECSGTAITYFRSLVDMTGKTVMFSGDEKCYSVVNEIFTSNTKDWSSIYSDCDACEASKIQGQLKNVNLLTKYENNDLSGKTASELNSEFKCLPCVNAVQYNTVKALNVPMNVGHQVYNDDGTKNTSLNGSFASISTSNSETDSVCNQGAVVFPLIYTFNNGVVTYAKAGTINECYKLPTTAETVDLDCGEKHVQGEDSGRKVYNITSNGVGDLTVKITGDEVPCNFFLKWNGEVVSTGYIGLDTYDDQLLANGVSAGDINTGSTSTKNTNITINKTSSYPNIVQLEVFSPLLNDEYEVEVIHCPLLPDPTFTTRTNIEIWNAIPTAPGLHYVISSLTNDYWPDSLRSCVYASSNPGPVGFFDSSDAPDSWNAKFFSYPFFNFATLTERFADGLKYYEGNIFNVFVDGAGAYYNSTGSATTDSNMFNYMLRAMNQYLNATNSFYILYVINPGTSTAETRSYNYLLQMLEITKTTSAPTGLKELYDNGRFKIVYNLERRTDRAYYTNIVAGQINNLNGGFNLNCG